MFQKSGPPAGFLPATANPLALMARAGRTGVAMTPSEALAFAKSAGASAGGRLGRAPSNRRLGLEGEGESESDAGGASGEDRPTSPA
jgi:hypothetical protein